MKCPGCEAYVNPAWDRCHACGGALKGAAFIETVKPDTPGPAPEADFQRVTDRHRNRAARLTPDGTGELIAKAWPGLHRRIVAADAELNRLWLAARRGNQPYPQTFPAFVAACRTWTQLNLQAARYVRYLDRGIRRIYSRKVDGWIYLVRDKASVRGVRLRPAGVVYSLKECAALVDVNPSADELRMLHRAKMMFQGELSA